MGHASEPVSQSSIITRKRRYFTGACPAGSLISRAVTISTPQPLVFLTVMI
jgi:hypothetical protein